MPAQGTIPLLTTSTSSSSTIDVTIAQSTSAVTKGSGTTSLSKGGSAYATLLETFQGTVDILGNSLSLPQIGNAAVVTLDCIRLVQVTGQKEEMFRSLATDMGLVLFLAKGIDDVDNELEDLVEEIKSDIGGLKYDLLLRQDTSKMDAFIGSEKFKSKLGIIDDELKMAIAEFQRLLKIETDEDMKMQFKEYMEEQKSMRKLKKSEDGAVKLHWEDQILDVKQSINIPIQARRYVDQTIKNSTWISHEGSLNMSISAGYPL